MKVRVSMLGATAAVELEEDKAKKVFKELAGQLLIFRLGEGTSVHKPVQEPLIESMHEPVQEEIPEETPTPLLKKDEQPTKEMQGYKGFLYIKCPTCGEVKGFCSKRSLTHHQCECGDRVELHDLVPICVRCECGKSYRYLTNMEEPAFDINCMTCGSPMAVQWNDKKKQYETM